MEIHSQQEQDAVNTAHQQSPGKGFWLGLSKSETGGWKWETSKTLASNLYSNWRPGEPNNAGGKEDCAGLRKWEDAWTDLACHTRSDFYPLCKQGKQTVFHASSSIIL